MRNRAPWILPLLVAPAVLGGAFVSWSAPPSRPQQEPAPATAPVAGGRVAQEDGFVGRGACAECHAKQVEAWTGSHHDLAMQPATEATVLGDFADAELTHFGVTSRFTRKDGRFLVRTEGPDGKLHDYEIAYVFGFTPLQQYLVAFPRGRYQMLPLCWDTRPREQGGQRWFHIYPDERIAPDDVLHWTGPNQNWNYMCAECHSTHLRKNYDLEHDAYRTTWSEIDVSCEACHGPGAEHVAWARAVERGERPENEDPARGLKLRLKDADQDIWVYDKKTGNAKRLTPRTSTAVIETCARCHARRVVVSNDYVHGRPFMDTHRVRLLRPELYFADGQILEEVYVYGSFLQSKMFHRGVNCRDCHDPHSLKLRAPGNEVCHRCHLAAKFDTPLHHFHERESTGASCADCHMPERTFMVVDPRRDHSIRVPRPDLSERLGTPNACNKCHADKSAAWASEAMDKWYGRDWRKPHFAEAIHAGRMNRPDADRTLAKLASDPERPAIVRATAIGMLRPWPGPASRAVLEKAVNDPDPLVRYAALDALESHPPELALGLAFPLLTDPIRAVRVQAANLLASVPPVMFTADQRSVFERAVAEYVQSELANADRASAHLNLGVLYTRLGDAEKAEAAYRTALRLEPRFVEARINLADLYRSLGRDDDGRRLLEQAVRIDPGRAAAHHALGLLLVRQRQLPPAIEALRRASELEPANVRFAYVYAVALHTAGRSAEAVAVLEKAHARNPGDRDVLMALVTVNRERGARDAAFNWARKLVAVAPEDPAARRLLRQLELERR